MLKKKICIKCWNLIDGIGWTEYNGKLWKKGEVYCPIKYVGAREGNIRKIIGKPPENCPYYLENTI